MLADDADAFAHIPAIAALTRRAREAADTIDRLTSSGEAPVYRVDWENAPRDGSWVLLLSKGDHADYRIEQRLFWSKHYSIHGLGGCWSDGFVTMSDLDFIGWRFDASPREGHVEVPVESEMRTLAEHCAGLMNKLSDRGHTGLMQECPLCQAYIGAARLLAHETDTPMPDEVVIWDRRLEAAALPHNQGETKP
jgi:hypothetical protein